VKLKDKKDSSVSWFAIYTMPRSEKKVFDRLLEVGIEAYLPLFTSYRIWSDRKKKITAPLISSYVFVKSNEKKLNELLKIQGIMGILKYLKKPAKIRDVEIENLKILLNDSENITLLEEGMTIEKGDKVRVIKGPFKGLIAECYEVKGKHRIIAAISTVNHFFEVNVPMSFLEKI
jgi:transcription antitermination factor NusG